MTKFILILLLFTISGCTPSGEIDSVDNSSNNGTTEDYIPESPIDFVDSTEDIKATFDSLSNTDVIEGYMPSEPINFPHDIHAGELGLDCRYCHNNASKSGDLPSKNICMECHKVEIGQSDPIIKKNDSKE